MRIQATSLSFIDNIVIIVLLLQIVLTIPSTPENFHIDTKNRTVYGTVRFSSTKYRTAYGIKNRPPYRTEPYENRRYGIYRSTVRSSIWGAYGWPGRQVGPRHVKLLVITGKHW